MVRVFVFEDYCDCDYDPLKDHVNRVDINEKLAELEEEGWSIINIQHQVIYNYRSRYETFDKNIYTVMVERTVYEDK